MSNLPLVSIVTPSYNQAQFLEDTLRSVLAQEYPKVEYIVIDGGSTDGSVDIIQRYASQLAYWVSERDKGQVDAINKGLQRAKGEIVAWLNSDDLYMAGAIQQAVDALQANPAAGMVYGDGLMVDADLRLLDPHAYRTYDVLDLLCFEVLLQPTVFMRREILVQAGYLRQEYDLILDHDLWLRMAALAPLLHVPAFWAVERSHAEAKTIALAEAFVREAEEMIERARMSAPFQAIIEGHERRVHASLHAFAARRLIDAGQYFRATRRMLAAFRLDSQVAARYWYKFVQASLSMIGLWPAFLAYRSLRRSLQHRGARVILGAGGAELRNAPDNNDSRGDV